MLSAPLLAALGERPDILLYMRGAMLPLFAAVLACTYFVARRVYSERVALWSVVILSLFPPFFLKSIEYRTDNLWNALWMIALLLVIAGPPAAMRWFFAGLILGCALAVSMKTSLLLITLVGAGLITRFALRDRTPFARPALAAFAGFLIVPSALAAYFASVGAWDKLVYCVITFNTLIEDTRPHEVIERYLWPFAIAAIVYIARREAPREFVRMFCAVALAVFLVTLIGLWTLISPRDMLPVMPLGAMFVVAVFERYDDRVTIAVVASTILTISLFYYAERFENRTEEFITAMNQVIGLTRPGEPIMDIKGETIYRPRPFYYIFEAITRAEIADGDIADLVPESVIAAHCHVAQADGPMFPMRARQFLNENFMDMGRLRASGQWIAADGVFTIAVPGRYVIINERGEAPGTLDGILYAGSRDLAEGTHHWVDASDDRIAVLWAPAFERGFSPFHLKDRNFRYRARHSRLKRFR